MHRIPDLLRGPRNRLPQIRLLWSRGLGDIIRKYKSELEFGVPAEGSTRARHGPTIRHASTPLHHSRFGSMVSMERRSLIIFHDWTGEDNWESGVERWTLSVIGLERRELWFIIFFFQFYDPFFWERERMVLERIVFTYRLDVKYLVFLVISLFSLWKILLKFRFELSNVNIAGHRVSDRDWFTKFRVSNFRVTGVKFDGLLLLKGRRSNYRHS